MYVEPLSLYTHPLQCGCHVTRSRPIHFGEASTENSMLSSLFDEPLGRTHRYTNSRWPVKRFTDDWLWVVLCNKQVKVWGFHEFFEWVALL